MCLFTWSSFNFSVLFHVLSESFCSLVPLRWEFGKTGLSGFGSCAYECIEPGVLFSWEVSKICSLSQWLVIVDSQIKGRIPFYYWYALLMYIATCASRGSCHIGDRKKSFWFFLVVDLVGVCLGFFFVIVDFWFEPVCQGCGIMVFFLFCWFKTLSLLFVMPGHI